LCGNVILNRLDNYYAYNKAVGDYTGEIDIPELNYDTCYNIGAFSVDKKFRELNGSENFVTDKATPVPIITLDSLVLKKSPSLIKIDVEGYEINVIRGGAAFLRQHNFPPILFEAWHEEWFSQDRQELLMFVMGLGYEITQIHLADYLAQHPSHAVKVEFVTAPEGGLSVVRTR
jgi:FkbM family methyltransferase